MVNDAPADIARMATVPIIDIAGYGSGARAEQKAVVDAVDAACRAVGFFVVTGHGVPEDVIDRADRASRALFDLSQAEKLRHRPSDPSVFRGYVALGTVAAAYSLDDRKSVADYRESFTMSRERIDWSDPYYAAPLGRRVFQPNIWPDAVPEYREAWTAYYDEMEKLARTILAIFEEALGLPRDWFWARSDKHMSTMAAMNYPDQASEPVPGQLRCGAHTDFGAITLLRAEANPGGLEVLTRDGAWEVVPIAPNSYIVNIGDLMKRWTNDLWESSYHRVVNPPRAFALGSRRQSLVYFFHPNYDTVIERLPTRLDEEAKYPPTTVREHLMSKISKMRDVAKKPDEMAETR
jgi:isopenicillin N synthase-like dioxygenase